VGGGQTLDASQRHGEADHHLHSLMNLNETQQFSDVTGKCITVCI
jgi:hypothetical protein